MSGRSRGVLLAFSLALGAPGRAGAVEIAEAEIGYRVDMPAEIEYSPELSATIVGDFAGSRRYRDAALRVNGRAYADSRSGVAIYLTWLITQGKVADPEGAIAEEIDRKRQRPTTAGPAEAIEVVRWAPTVTEKLVTTELEFADRALGLRTRLRSVVFLDPEGRVHEVNVECMLRDGVTAKTQAACDRALASLEVTVAPDQRGSIAVGAPALAPERLAFAQPADSGAGSAPATGTGASGGAGTTGAVIAPAADGKPLYVAEPRAAKGSRRWMLYAGGALVVVALIWLARKRRDESAGDDGGTGPKGAA